MKITVVGYAQDGNIKVGPPLVGAKMLSHHVFMELNVAFFYLRFSPLIIDHLFYTFKLVHNQEPPPTINSEKPRTEPLTNTSGTFEKTQYVN